MGVRHDGCFDIAVIGAGIAGASVAAELAASARVVLLERESQPGYHTTGRSAALFSATYGPPAIRALTRASAAFYEAPPPGFSATPLLSARGALMIARHDQLAALDRMVANLEPGAAVRLDAGAARARAPLLRPGHVAGALYEDGARDIDVHALLHGFLRRLRASGGVVRTGAAVTGLAREGETWGIETRGGTLRAAVVVNAAGAWADEIAIMAGARPAGLVPKRRTAMIVAAPAGVDPSPWPIVVDIDEAFYMKPDAGRLLLSPADATPSPPCDAQPEELDVAICVDRVETAFDITIGRIENRWAGLRSFLADGVPMAGFDPVVPGFFWLVGQGGYGIQTAPALSRVAASLVTCRAVPGEIADHGVDAAVLAPGRAGLYS